MENATQETKYDQKLACATVGPWSVGKDVRNESWEGSSWVVPVYADNAPSGDKLPAEARAMNREQARANARLIAAAPELAEALAWALDMIIVAQLVPAGLQRYRDARTLLASLNDAPENLASNNAPTVADSKEDK